MFDSDSDSASHRPLLLVLVTLFLSVAAEFIPWPSIVWPIKPNFPMLVLVYWVVHQPKIINYAAAIVIGLIMDLANQAPIGYNALSSVIVVCATNIFSNRFILLTAFAQSLHVLAVLALGQLCLYALGFLEDSAAQPPLTWTLFTPSMAAAALWLFLPIFMRSLRNILFRRSGHDAAY